MNEKVLITTAKAMMAPGKGLIAMDESLPTCNKRFAAIGIPQTEEMRRAYREMIVTTPHFGDAISGAILFDETIRQKLSDGTTFVDALKRAGIIPGIKVDAGAKPMAGFPGEELTEGLDGLPERMKEYGAMGAKFAKWRAVIKIDAGIPTQGSIDANALLLARYAAICQAADIVPIVEPEVLMDGSHSLETCFAVTERVQHTVFAALIHQHVLLEGMILKPNMVLPGIKAAKQNSVDEVADATIKCLRRTVPAAVPGVAFLSGGQPAEDASARLNSMNARYAAQLPWAVTFSYSRAIQQPALERWRGKAENVKPAQEILLHRATANSAARRGEYQGG
jgi:fructose-bisphosphate aldolase class I